MFKLFGKKSDEKSEGEILEIEVQKPVDCLCDFTYNFHWQHKGKKLDPSWKIPGNTYTFGYLIEHLKNGGDVKNQRRCRSQTLFKHGCRPQIFWRYRW